MDSEGWREDALRAADQPTFASHGTVEPVSEPLPSFAAPGEASGYTYGGMATVASGAPHSAPHETRHDGPIVPAEEFTVGGGKVVRSVASLLLREGFLKIVVLAANIVLARLLVPSDFGIFVILGFFNSFLVTFGAFGLAAALVQRHQPPQREELGALFTFQVVVAALLVVMAEIAAPTLASVYHLGEEGEWLIRAMALGFLLTSAAATPMALLERRLAFGRVALVDVSIGVLYQALAIGLALVGFRVWSLVIATLASNILGALLTYGAAGWRPHISLRWRPIFPLIGYGLKYQANSFISLLKDNITPTFVAFVAGAAAVGYINWASTLAFYPILIVNLIGRVTFPAFSRVANDRARLQEMIEATIRIQAYIIFPIVAALAVFAPYITSVIFTDKWQPAVPVLYFMLVSTALSGVSTPLVAGLNALGKPGVISRLMFMWLILDWGLIVPLVLKFGIAGYGVANAIVALSGIVTVAIFKRHQPVRFVRSFFVPVLTAGVSGLAFLAIRWEQPPTTIAPLVAQALGLCALFAALEAVADRRFVADLRYLVGAIRGRSASRLSAAERGAT